MGSDNKHFIRFPIPATGADKPHMSELLVRKSRFVTYTAHCRDACQAREFAGYIRLLNASATHNCWAFVAGAPGDTASIGCSDDGEPHGTAGKPMLKVLLHCGIGQICVVVSRWFGGIKLGTGGLARAYQDAVQENLATLDLAEKVPLSRLKVVLDYRYLDTLKRMLGKLQTNLHKEEYGETASMELSLPLDKEKEFIDMLATATNGSAIIEIVKTRGNG